MRTHLPQLGLTALFLSMPALAHAQIVPPVTPSTPTPGTPVPGTAAPGTSDPGLPQSSTDSAPTPQETRTPLPKSTTTPDLPKPDPATQPSAGKTKAEAARAKTDSIPSPGEDLNPHIKPGSEEDVNAIGTRSIGGRGLGNWYSTDWEIRVGKSYSVEVERSAHLVTDPVIVEYVNRIGQNLVKNSDAKVPFTIKVIDSDEVNAFALPGGFFYVNSGLIAACDEEAELAGVMAHEISHVIAHHAARQQTKGNYAQIASIPLIIMAQGSYAAYGAYEASQLAIPLTFLKFSRESEAEADFLGIQYMYKAGYDPQSFITLFEKLQALEKHKPGALARAFADHPQTADRVASSEDEIATILPPRPDYVVTTSEFDDVKARLARLENKRKINDKKDSSKPTLRRAGASNNDPGKPDSTSTGDDRPTLGRRN